MIWDALLLGLGYNATLVTLGAGILGIAGGVGGSFLFLRKRALVSDAVSHATLPGVGLAFVLMVAMGGDGRNLIGLLAGGAVSAAIGLLCVNWLSTRTRLAEDAAIGAVLSVFFGFGIVVLTYIQTMSSGRQAGLESFLLGSTAGMLQSDALVLVLAAALTLALVLILRRPLTLVAFDPDFALATGRNVNRIDLAMMGIVLAVTVVGLKIVGLILIVALLIIPPVTARFWTERVDRVLLGAGIVGGLSGYVGAAISAAVPDVPTGPIIVLVSFALFMISLLCAPGRGVVSSVVQHRQYQRRVHLRQGLLALAQGQPIYERLTQRLMERGGLMRGDGVATDKGRAHAAQALLDEARWQVVRSDQAYAAAALRYDGLTEMSSVLTPDQLRDIDARLPAPQGVTP
ncbi:metal ABC transporter permease [Sulfitobacter pseudonitzschiae]|uniref:Metal ABC transporter permease n=1 Tax=Pseudosulfitobacter pseudonitzschiae TaxID=1402135 RepID=A0A9Q2NYN2_9RHOB|nr:MULTISPECIES: iron chelate uptake ABC transporter family permease subunit [Roseobacteraceae]MBM2290330.1 metal ABC transporter permease [Pseudosulfitobacter pseudonitzschiae]MBM2295248.1 metal ABC transporter permease [Pseudosulfitobacter pseudonitzschiae]MBM2300160.1 metal ABC transporter permease [Pseudosulfitobacter pseudonitzschiae]MBM2309945.1 metal ABC transporter permease [Pseudosulfitobacter pseudonitzschiae]MBM2314857.1 metal ABC transporter permease [Pseudosulfitobacter pseudonitz|tara:strand:- start:4735 stop:5940 length:1206 start_codon:yes stop_codon:yes gene_type:complete